MHGLLGDILNIGLILNAFSPRGFKILLLILKGPTLDSFHLEVVCPGISFALANIELVLSRLLYHFNWKLPNEIKPKELDMSESFGISYRRKNDLYLIATPLKPLLHEKH